MSGCGARALDARQGDLRADATAISYHWMAAHSVTNAFSASIAAMIQARQSYAFSSAARVGERAIELWEQVPDAETLAGGSRVELLVETSSILRKAGEIDRAIALIDEAIAASGDLLDRALELDPPIGFSTHLQRLKLQSVLWSDPTFPPEGARLFPRAGTRARPAALPVAGGVIGGHEGMAKPPIGFAYRPRP